MLAHVTEPPKIDTSVPHPARVYDYWLGGKDNFEADRVAAEAAITLFPPTAQSARANRAFLSRVVRYLADEAGIRQFLDVGTGLPTAENVHEVAQAVVPESRIVYVDNDPIVLLHARTLLTSSPEGATDYIAADLRDTELILREARRTLDFTRPVAVLLLAILHFIPDSENPHEIVRTLRDAAPAGSYVAISHLAPDIHPEIVEGVRQMNEHNPQMQFILRDRDQVAAFFDGLDLVEPGVVPISKWRPSSEIEAVAPGVLWGGVARKP